jgi:hypothetical protein
MPCGQECAVSKIEIEGVDVRSRAWNVAHLLKRIAGPREQECEMSKMKVEGVVCSAAAHTHRYAVRARVRSVQD